MTRLLTLLLALGLCAPAPAQAIKTGTLIRKIICKGTTYSYAIYVPKKYSKNKKWPVLYAFHPGGHGFNFVYQCHQACEKRGWIVAGSNDSRNGPLQEDAIDAMWADVRRRWSIDDTRVYATGFSGGSRVATWFADRVKGAGNIAIGGVFLGRGPLPKIPYYLTCGATDMNRREMELAHKQHQAARVPVKLKIFPGGHDFPKKAIFAEAINWLDGLVNEKKKKELEAKIAALEEKSATDPLGAYKGAKQLIKDNKGAKGLARARALLSKLGASKKLQREIKGDAALAKLDVKFKGPLTTKSAHSLITRYESLAKSYSGTKAALTALSRATELSRKYP